MPGLWVQGIRPRGHKHVLSWEDSSHLHPGMQVCNPALLTVSCLSASWRTVGTRAAFQLVLLHRSRPLTPAVLCCLVATPGSLSQASLAEVMSLRAEIYKLWCTISGMWAASNLYSLWRKLVLLGMHRTQELLLSVSPKISQLGNTWSDA